MCVCVYKLIYNTGEEMKLLHRCRRQIAGRQMRGEVDSEETERLSDWKLLVDKHPVTAGDFWSKNRCDNIITFLQAHFNDLLQSES